MGKFDPSGALRIVCRAWQSEPENEGNQMNSEENKQGPVYLALKPSEKAVFECASRIFAAYISSGKVTEENKSDYYKTAVRDAIRIAEIVEKQIQSDDELAAPKG